MLDEDLQQHVLDWKLNWLNGYLQALACLISVNGLFFRCQLIKVDFVAGDAQRSLQHHAYDLFGQYPDDWAIDLIAIDDWQQSLIQFVQRHLQLNQGQHAKQWLTQSSAVLQFFCTQLKQLCLGENTEVFEMVVHERGFYRIIGLDLVFDLAGEQLLVLQILGAD